jgi:hypothetical protein
MMSKPKVCNLFPALMCACALVLPGCVHDHFQFQFQEPLELAELLENSPGEEISAEAYGYMWTPCPEVNQEAMAKLRTEMESRGKNTLVKLRWFDYGLEEFVDEPRCLTEYAWIAGTISTFWWYEATKISLKASAITTPETGPETYKRRTIGQPPLQGSQGRIKLANAYSVTGEVMAGLVFGLGLKFGRFLDTNSGISLRTGVQTYFGETQYGPRLGDSTSVTLNYFRFLGETLKVQWGAGLAKNRWLNYSRINDGDNRRTKRWADQVLGLDLALDNTWTLSSGLNFGVEWLGAFVPLKTLETEGDIPPKGKYSDAKSRRQISWRLLNMAFGMDF